MESPHAVSVDELRAVAHPTRIQMMALLAYQGPLRATDLGQRLGLAPNAASYHLRLLARAGLVTEAPNQGGDKRERWWQSSHHRYDISDPSQAPQVFTHIRTVIDRALAQAVQPDAPADTMPTLWLASAYLPIPEFEAALEAIGETARTALEDAAEAARARKAPAEEWQGVDVILVASPAPAPDGAT